MRLHISMNVAPAVGEGRLYLNIVYFTQLQFIDTFTQAIIQYQHVEYMLVLNVTYVQWRSVHILTGWTWELDISVEKK